MFLQNLYLDLFQYFYASLDELVCTTKDNDECILNTPGWETASHVNKWSCNYFTIAGGYRHYCDDWAKDTRRCCPETCENSKPFTKTVCEASPGKGTCIYQCGNEHMYNCSKKRFC